MKQLSRLLALGFAAVLSNAAIGYEVETHEEMSAQAAQRSMLATTALSDIGLGPLATERLVGRSILDWICHGANHEDDIDVPAFRFQNHFYNPLTGEGFTGFWFPFRGFFAGLPSPTWGLEDATLVPDQYYSLMDARDYFYKGLTLPSKAEREPFLALTFNTLGHVIHLIQDAAQPQHTRDDSHGTGSLYEKITNDLRGNLPYSGYPSGGRTVLFTRARDFWHTSPPESDPFQNPQLKKGVAEYSNRGFVSAGTNFRYSGGQVVTANGFPSPAFDPASEWSAEIGQLIQQFPDCPFDLTDLNLRLRGQFTFYKNTVVDSYEQTGTAINQYTTTTSIFDDVLRKLFGTRFFTLNKFNYCAANRFLVPRAVGYSSGLIDYFFRGRLEIVNATDNGQLRITVKNISGPDNTLRNGVFELYYETLGGLRKQLPIREGSLVDNSGIADGITRIITADIPSDLDVAQAHPYFLVYKGNVGLEQAVAGKAITKKQAEKFIYVLHRDGVLSFRKDGTFVSRFGYAGAVGVGGNPFIPGRVAIDGEYLYLIINILDGASYVQMYTKSGAFVSQFSPVDPGSIGSRYVSAIAVDTDRIYLITNDLLNNARTVIQAYTKKGSFISQFTPIGQRAFSELSGITIDDQYIYAFVGGPFPISGIQIFTKSGDFVTEVRLPDPPFISQDDPIGIAVDDRYIYVAGEGGETVYVFTKSGELVSQFVATSPYLADQYIADMAADNENIYFASEYTNVVRIFSKTGSFISQFEAPSNLVRSGYQFQFGIAVDK